MEIRDVIGDLRQQHLEVMRKVNEIRLQLHVLEYRVSKLDTPVSRETKEDASDGPVYYVQDPLPDLETAP